MSGPEAGTREQKERGQREFEVAFFSDVLRRAPRLVSVLKVHAENLTHLEHYEEGLRADELLASLCPDEALVHFNLACSLSLLGRSTEAIDRLDRAVALGYCDWEWMVRDPDLAGLHELARFQALIQRLRRPSR